MIINPYLVQPSGTNIVTSDLLMNLDAGNSSSYPGTGTTWTDLTGNGYNATLYNGVSYSSSNGGILIYDGVDDYAKAALTKSTVNANGKFTFQFWVYISGSQSTVGLFQMANVLSSPTPWLLLQRSNPFTIRWLVAGAYWMTQTISADTWYNVAITYDGTTWTSYTNGSVQNTQVAGVGSDGASDLYIAQGFASYASCTMPDMLVYTTNLTSTQIQQNFDARKSRYGF